MEQLYQVSKLKKVQTNVKEDKGIPDSRKGKENV